MNRTEWQKRRPTVSKSATRPALDLQIARIGGKQRQLVTLRQFTHFDFTASGVTKRVEAGRLFRVFEGVFCLHPPPFSRHQMYLAATYACGPGTAVSDLAAAWLLGASESPPSLPIVSNATGNGRSIDGIEVHRRRIDPRDVFEWSGIACTRPERTVLDCAASSSIEELEELLMALDSKQPKIRRWRLDELVDENAGRRGIRNLRLLITDDPKDTDAENERRMLRICRRYGVSEPETQYPISAGGNNYRADFCWPSLRLIVECDSWRWHGGKLKSEGDANRDQLLAIAGWIVVRFTRNQIKLMPMEVGQRLVALISGRQMTIASAR